MFNLVRPDWDAAEDYREIVRRSIIPTEPTRRKYLNQVIEEYDRYGAIAPRLEDMAPLAGPETKREAQHLYGCYEHPHVQDEVKPKIRNLQSDLVRDRCQLCAGMTVADTWDHYLPRALFVQFSACAYNLMPACWRCNTLRQEKGWLDNGARTTLHLYYDRIVSDVAYLTAQLEADSKTGLFRPVFDVQMPEDGDHAFYAAYRRHFKTLKLDERFAADSVFDLRRIVRSVRSWSALGLSCDAIRKCLTDTAQGEPFGPNSPKAALHRAAAHSEAFLDYALSGTPT